jgi:hypothetical protein
LILREIKSKAFVYSGLKSLFIPGTTCVVDSSALASVEGATIEIKSDSKFFMIANDQILTVDGRCFMRWFVAGVCVTVPASVQVFSCQCFGDCDNLAIVAFEPGSMLWRIQTHAFRWCGSLVATSILAPVEILCSECFMDCQGLADVSFDAGSQMHRLYSRLCYGSALSSVIIPRKG